MTLSMIDPSQTKQLQSQLSTMQQSQSDQRAKELVEKYVLTNRINPNDKDQIATALAFARENPTRFEQIMGSTQPLVPHSKTTPPSATTTRRDQVIGKASREFADEEGLQKITDQTAHVNCALREHSMAKLTEDELTTLSV